MVDDVAGDGGALSRRPTERILPSLLDFSGPPPGETSLSQWLLVQGKAVQQLIDRLETTHTREELEEAINMVLEQMVTVESTTSADNADFLAGTQLDQPGVPGVYTIWAASTVGDTEMTVSLGGRTLVSAQQVVLRANSEIRENEDSFIQAVSRTGGRPVININVITSAVVRIRVKFLPATAS